MHRISSNQKHAEWSEKFLRASLPISLIYGDTQEKHKRTNREILQGGSIKKLIKIEERKGSRHRRRDQSKDRKRAKIHFLGEKKKTRKIYILVWATTTNFTDPQIWIVYTLLLHKKLQYRIQDSTP